MPTRGNLAPTRLAWIMSEADALVPASPPHSGSHAEIAGARVLLVKAHRVRTTLLPEATYPETLARRALSREVHRHTVSSRCADFLCPDLTQTGRTL